MGICSSKRNIESEMVILQNSIMIHRPLSSEDYELQLKTRKNLCTYLKSKVINFEIVSVRNNQIKLIPNKNNIEYAFIAEPPNALKSSMKVLYDLIAYNDSVMSCCINLHFRKTSFNMRGITILEKNSNTVVDTIKTLCIACQTNTIAVALYPCGHACMCNDCCEKYKKDTCPLCRTNIENRHKLYISGVD